MTIYRPHPIFFLGGRSADLYRSQLTPRPRRTQRIADTTAVNV